MNRKTFRYLVPLVLLFGLIFTAVASADSVIPTVGNSVCVGLEGSRAEGNIETVDWEIREAGTSNVRYNPSDGGSTEAVYDASETRACFEVIGVPGSSYDLYIKGEDSLSVLISNYVYQPEGGETDYSGTITLQEGDVASSKDDAIIGSDVSALVSRFNQAGDPGDLNEDGSVLGSDVSLLISNFGLSGPTNTAAVVSNRSSQLAPPSIRFEPATLDVSSGQAFDVRVIIDNSDSEEIDSVQLVINYDSRAMQFDPAFGSSAGFAFLVQDNCPLANDSNEECEFFTDAAGETSTAIGPTIDANGNSDPELAGRAEVFVTSSVEETGTGLLTAVLRFEALTDISPSRRTLIEFEPAVIATGVEDGTIWYRSGTPNMFSNLGEATNVDMSSYDASTQSLIAVVSVAFVILAAFTVLKVNRRVD